MSKNSINKLLDPINLEPLAEGPTWKFSLFQGKAGVQGREWGKGIEWPIQRHWPVLIIP